MKSIHSLLLNLLVGLLAFIVFFILFESRIAVPPALQVLGRAHPLFLHFPIVLLVLAWLLACFGKRLLPEAGARRGLIYLLLLASAWGAALSAVAGLLLSKEGGYEGPSFLWHKWSGVALCFLTATLLWYHRKDGRQSHNYRFYSVGGLSVSVILLFVAGHFGATLTHGEDYLLAPVRPAVPKGLDVETAKVFPDVIYPILKAKCLGCHSAGKAKGELVLADSASILKGGESGALFTTGNVDQEGLLVQRLLLDPDHEHHMPPKGKPQLGGDELALIRAWARAETKFDAPLSALAPGDSLRELALAVYGAAAGEAYSFQPADPEIVEDLNTSYRTVRPVAEDSPALEVAFFGKASYSDGALSELEPVVEQVVSLILSGMPLSESDKEMLKSFVNLQKLKLNDTPVDDTWSETLVSLPQLRSVSLSGTAITEQGLARILTAPKLKQIYIWNTAIAGPKVAALQQQKGIRIEQGYVDDGSTLLPLNPPTVVPKHGFFSREVEIVLNHPISGTELRYTLDGSAPDSTVSPLYDAPFELQSDAVVKVKAFKKGWLPSEETVRTFSRSDHRAAPVYLMTAPDPRYKGRGAHTLTDLESGGDNIADGNWLGFHGKPLEASLHFDGPVAIDSLGISFRQDYGGHIYPPKKISVWGGPDSLNATLLQELQPELQRQPSVQPKRLLHMAVGQKDIRYLRVRAEPFVPIPTGYPAEGNPAWIFADEILIR